MKIHNFNQDWTLFLDRDGVINERIPNHYIDDIKDFRFTLGAVEAIVNLNRLFGKTIVVTNQKGVGKGLMSLSQLDTVHTHMEKELHRYGGKIDAIYTATGERATKYSNHKPSPVMGVMAQQAFPNIDFKKSVMIGDSISDIQFGKNLGMVTVLVEGKQEEIEAAKQLKVDFRVKSLAAWGKSVLGYF